MPHHALPEVMLAARRTQRGGGGGKRSADRGRQPVWREKAEDRTAAGESTSGASQISKITKINKKEPHLAPKLEGAS